MTTESDIQNAIRIRTSQMGWRLFRNNCGALQDKTGRWVRFGLGNDSKAASENLKSADLIGVRPVLITQEMVGQTVGQFVSIEVKRPGGRTAQGQQAWRDLINSLGGYAIITDKEI